MKSKKIIKMEDLGDMLTQHLDDISRVGLCGDQGDIETFIEAKNKLEDFIDEHWPKPFELP